MKNTIRATLVALFTLLSSHTKAQTLTKAPAWSSFESFAWAEDMPHKTNSVLVLKDGQVVYERYRPGFNAKTPQQLWSLSKSITGLVIGRAIADSLLKLDDPIQKYFPKAPAGVTLSHLLDMVSGYDWNEGYEFNPINSDVVRMLYTTHYDDMASFAANKALAHQPGEFFQYSSGTSNILMGALAKTMGPGDYAAYPWRTIFEPMKMESAVWERDHKGTFIASSYLYLSAPDLAKIGQLFLDHGRYQDQQIISEQWLIDSTLPNPYFMNPERDLEESENFAYSKQWWLNTALPFPDGSFKSRYPSLPANAILGLGHWGQILLILPDQHIVMVRTGNDKAGRMNRDEFFGRFMRALQQAYP